MVGRKLKDSRGETLVEMLASILIAALSVAVLFTCCMASVEMGNQSRAADEEYYKVLSAAERRADADKLTQEGAAATVEIQGNGTNASVEIYLYGGEGMYSYKKGG